MPDPMDFGWKRGQAVTDATRPDGATGIFDAGANPATTETLLDKKRIEERLARSEKGFLKPIGNVTLTNGATSTVVQAKFLVSSTSMIVIEPLNAAAQAEKIASTWLVTPSKGFFTISHSNAATTRTFRWAAFSGILP